MRKILYMLLFVSLFCASGCKINGTITHGGSSLEGITVILTGDNTLSTITDSKGEYAFEYLKPGTYTVRPLLNGYDFDPEIYTVTLDCLNMNGLDGLDFSVVSVTEPPAASPDEIGPYSVGYYKTNYTIEPFGTYEAVIRYPALSDGLRSPKDSRGAPYPGIGVCNGFLGQESQITWIAEHLSSHGYVTICFTPPDVVSSDITQWATGLSSGITRLKHETLMSNSPVGGLVDTERLGSIGLSMGGGGSIEAAGSLGSEIDAAVALAPAGYSPAGETDTMEAARNIDIPIQIQVGASDGMVPPARVLPYYDTVITGDTIKEYVEINGGNHIGFIDEKYAEIADMLNLDNPMGIAFSEQRRLSCKYFTSWFQYFLKGLTGYHAYLFGQDAQDDLTAGRLSQWKYNLP